MIEARCQVCDNLTEIRASYRRGIAGSFHEPPEYPSLEDWDEPVCRNCGEEFVYEDVLDDEQSRRSH